MPYAAFYESDRRRQCAPLSASFSLRVAHRKCSGDTHPMLPFLHECAASRSGEAGGPLTASQTIRLMLSCRPESVILGRYFGRRLPCGQMKQVSSR